MRIDADRDGDSRRARQAVIIRAGVPICAATVGGHPGVPLRDLGGLRGVLLGLLDRAKVLKPGQLGPLGISKHGYPRRPRVAVNRVRAAIPPNRYARA